MMKMKITGANELVAKLFNIAERVPTNARKEMSRGSDRIVRDAKLGAPVDEHNLENSIEKTTNYVDQDGNAKAGGRAQVTITVGGIVNGVDVDEYAMKVHEAYDDAHPGRGTQAKRDANPGVHVGSKFLDRAIEKERPKLAANMIASVREGIK